jgi:hypothetical protein
VKDWRGTPIEVGALCIYGAPVGRSIALVEAEVVGYTKSGRINVRIVRRAYGAEWSSKEVVHVGADRLVVVNELPPSDVPLTSEAIAEKKAKEAERDRVEGTHDFPPFEWDRISRTGWEPCRRCGADRSTVRYDTLEECA